MTRTPCGRALIFGGGGFLGRAIAGAFVEAGSDVLVTWRRTAPPSGVPSTRVSADDLDQVTSVVSRFSPDVVVNALGGPHRPNSPDARLAAWRDSPVATAAILEACRDRRVRVVHLASIHEFAPSATPHRETDPKVPISLRGIAAHAATQSVSLWARETGNPAVILRPFSVYGPGEPSDRVVPTLLRAVRNGDTFRSTGSCARRDFVFVDDVAAAVVAACLRGVCGEFNLGTGVGTSVAELVTAAELASGESIAVATGSFAVRPWERESWVADPALAEAVLGWTAETSLVEGLRRLLT